MKKHKVKGVFTPPNSKQKTNPESNPAIRAKIQNPLTGEWEYSTQSAEAFEKNLRRLADAIESRKDSAFDHSENAPCPVLQWKMLFIPKDNSPLSASVPDWEEWEKRFGIKRNSPLAELVLKEIAPTIDVNFMRMSALCGFPHCGVGCKLPCRMAEEPNRLSDLLAAMLRRDAEESKKLIAQAKDIQRSGLFGKCHIMKDGDDTVVIEESSCA